MQRRLLMLVSIAIAFTVGVDVIAVRHALETWQIKFDELLRLRSW